MFKSQDQKRKIRDKESEWFERGGSCGVGCTANYQIS